MNTYLLFLVILTIPSYVYADLYNSSDPVVILDNKNIYETILNTKNGWIIEFYNSWCGHCIHFAPTWREFAKEVKDWSHTFKVGVLDCSDQENVPICRDYEVMAYPSIRIFGSSIKKGDIGRSVQKRTVSDLQEAIVDFILEKEVDGSSSSSWVNLTFYNKTVKNLLAEAPPSAKDVVFIVEDSNSKNGAFTILDLGSYPQVHVRRVQPDSSGAIFGGRLKPKTLPALVFVSRSKSEDDLELLEGIASTREELTAYIMDRLKLAKRKVFAGGAGLSTGKKDSNLPKVNTTRKGDKGRKNKHGSGLLKKEVEKGKWEGRGDPVPPLEGAGDGAPPPPAPPAGEMINSERLDYDDALPDAAFDKLKAGGQGGIDKAFMVDVENVVWYALKHEVALRKSISGEELEALKRFLEVLSEYLPARNPVAGFLSKVKDAVGGFRGPLPVSDYERLLEDLKSHSSFLPEMKPWMGCEGSQTKYRGYPCGLWTLFHTVTVNAYLKGKEDPYYDPLVPLRAIHGYVKHFFSCEYCSRHFQEMYAVDAESLVKKPSDEALWLWRGHNKVNKRLKGDLSEDPSHPKRQFPEKAKCPSCWKDDGISYDEGEVLQYLVKIYGKGSLSLEGVGGYSELTSKPLVSKELPAFNRQGKVYETINRLKEAQPQRETIRFVEKGMNLLYPNNNNNEDENRLYPQQQRSLKEREEAVLLRSTSNNNWGFNNTDLNLCVFLYLFSTVIIALGYFMFLLKRKLRRRKFIEMYKNP